LTRHSLLTGALLAAALSLAARSAIAQDYRPDRPYNGVFAPRRSNGGHQFEIDWAAMTAHDDNLTAEPELVSDPRGGFGGGWGSAEASARYIYEGQRTHLRATASGRDRYYPSLSNLSGVDAGGEFGASFDMSRNIRLSLSQAVRFQPYYQLTFVPSGSGSLGAAAPIDPSDVEISTPNTPAADDPLRPANARTINGGVGYAQKIGLKSRIALDYSYRLTSLADRGVPYFSQNLNALITRGLTRYAALRLGYGHGRSSGIIDVDGRTTTVRGAPQPLLTTHNVDVGIAYSRPLSRSRRTAFSFSTGSSVISDGDDSQYRLLLSATLAREIGRSWVANVDYRRGVTLIEGIAGPAYADTVRVRFGGFIARRVDVGATTGYAKGYVGLTTATGSYATYAETADLRIALSRNFSFVTEYGYYHYDFDPIVDLPFGIGHSQNRQSIRFGISGWLPIVR